jgi:hypothetical protein
LAISDYYAKHVVAFVDILGFSELVQRMDQDPSIIDSVYGTLAPGVSIARVAREHEVNANQVFQWRYEYRKGTLGGRQRSQPRTVAG